MDATVALLLAGLAAGGMVAAVFGDAPSAVAKLLALGAAAAPVAGWAFFELAVGPDLNGPGLLNASGAPLGPVVALIAVGAVLFFVAWTAGAVTALTARWVVLRR